ncbi:hypothetical protein GCM10027076_20560 [Nocardioides montaniterrae]
MIARLYLGIATLLIPWTVYLAITLPRRSVAHHYDAAWVGFDVLLTVVLARIGWLAARRHAHFVLTATAGATLLIVDAWFDVVTAGPGEPRVQAIVLALALELPGAWLCAMLARRGLATLVARAAATPRR